ncbi:MAG: DUF3526 domain-containing protein [Pseudomonadota bacterium]
MGDLRRELWWLGRDGAALVILALAALLAVLAVTLGTQEVQLQREHIAALRSDDARERAASLEAHAEDPGSVAYYSFHLTYSPPSPLAFAALGTRATHPWQHRVRMLAIEGQIYETDPGNPELVETGRLDYAFVAAIVLPLLVIGLLHDLFARERRHGRLEWLLATARDGLGVFRRRALVRAGLLWIALGVPLVGGAVINGTPLTPTLGVLGWVGVHIAFWALVCWFVARRVDPAATVATVLVGLWALTVICLPPVGALIGERAVSVPSGGALLLAQREKVNDAWDLPKDATMTPFLEQHPEWTDFAQVERPFEWKWYYAFQQVGDQAVADDSQALRTALRKRDRIMAGIALLSPPLLVERGLERLALTNVDGYLRYELCVRDFHADLREHYYPALFREAPRGPTPNYTPCDTLPQEPPA